MTISTTGLRVSYSGNGVTTDFSFPYKFLANGDLVVTLVASDGTETLQVLDTDYTVTGAGTASGTVAMVTPPALTESLLIVRELEITQEIDYITGGPFPAETHEGGLDRLTMICQQIDRQAGLSIKISEADSEGVDTTLPSPEALKYIRWKDDASGFENVDLDDLSVVDPSLIITPYTNLAALRLADTFTNAIAYLKEDGRAGTFKWDSSDLSTEVTADTQSGIYVAPSSDLTGASGAWVRQYSGAVNVQWFGAVGDGVTDDTAVVQSAVSLGGIVHFPTGTYLFKTQSGSANPTIEIPSNTEIDIAHDAVLVTEGGTGSGVNGYNQSGSISKALFVNSNTSTGNKNIKIHGGTIKSSATTAISSAFISLQNVSGVEVKDIKLMDIFGACRLQISYCADVVIRDVVTGYDSLHAAPYSFEDGIRVGSGCYNVSISDCIVYSGDDSIAINNELAETQNPLTSVTPFSHSLTGADIGRVNISNCLVDNQAGNALRIYQGPGMSTGLISDVVVTSLSGTPRHPATGWSTAISLFDNSGVTTNAIRNVTLSSVTLNCDALGTSGTGSPSAISIETDGGNINIIDTVLRNVSVPYGIGANDQTCIDNVSIFGCLNDSVYVNGDSVSVRGCRLSGPQVYGINVAATATNAMVVNNKIENAGAKSINVAPGADVYIFGNDQNNNPAASVYLSANQSATSGNYTKVHFDVEELDKGSCYDNTTNYRFQPQVAGWYLLTSTISSSGSTSATGITAAIYKNGLPYKYGAFLQAPSPDGFVSSIVYLNGSSDFTEIFVYISATTAVIAGGQAKSYMSAMLIR